MRKRLHDFPDQHSSSLILDTIFITKIGAYDPDLITKHPTIDESFYKYFIGLSPPCGKPWEGVKKVYTPFNIDNKHWVALEIQLDSKHIIVYDSQCNYYKEEVIAQKLAQTCQMLPILMMKSGVFPDVDDTPFVVERVSGLKQNEEGYLLFAIFLFFLFIYFLFH